jgi:hypothetical protein
MTQFLRADAPCIHFIGAATLLRAFILRKLYTDFGLFV